MPARSSTSATRYVIRPLRTQEEYRACVELQKRTWGESFSEVVPPSILMVSQKMGGIAAGAFDPEGRLAGFVFGISGLRNDRLAHWSDMLAVRRELRGQGLGRRLKAYQRERLLALGIEVVYWTYDPLEARNAHLNINRLGARPVEYVPNMYGETGSRLHGGLGTDRFVVEWEIASPEVARILGGGVEEEDAFVETPIVNGLEPSSGGPEPRRARRLDAARVRIEIPERIQELKERSAERAREWRDSTREAFLEYLERGYRVEGFRRDPTTGRCFYGLRAPGARRPGS